MESNYGRERLRGLCHNVFLGWRRFLNVKLYDHVLPASPRRNEAAQQNRSAARSLETCWLRTCRYVIVHIRPCVGRNL